MKLYLFLEMIKIKLDAFGGRMSLPGRLQLKTVPTCEEHHPLRRSLGSGLSVAARCGGRAAVEGVFSSGTHHRHLAVTSCYQLHPAVTVRLTPTQASGTHLDPQRRPASARAGFSPFMPVLFYSTQQCCII